MSRALGIHCDSRTVYLAIAEDGSILDGLPERLQPPSGLEEHERLWAVFDEVVRVMRLMKVKRAGLLLPESQYAATHGQMAPRVALETIVQMAASREGITVELLHRATTRSRLDLPRTGSLDSHVSSVSEPVGRYWTSGRGLAALVALAAEASG